MYYTVRRISDGVFARLATKLRRGNGAPRGKTTYKPISVTYRRMNPIMLHIRKILSLLCCVGILFAVCGCSGQKGGETPDTSSADSDASQNDAVETVGKILSTDVWEPVPFISKQLRDMGFKGGEGCQASATIVYDNADGKTAYFGTDVGGVYKSVDGGETWFPCNFDLDACGANHISVDPNNINRVLLVGCNSGYHTANGLYLTEDGERWDYVFKAEKDFVGMIGIHNDYRHQIAWDKSSNDEKIGGSAVAYWSREDYTTESKSGMYNHPAIYKTADGGKTWTELEGTTDIAGGDIRVDAANGNVIATSDKGAFLSTDGGKTWTKTLDEPIQGLDAVYTKPNYAWAITLTTIYQTSDAGKTWSEYASLGNYSNGSEIHSFVVSPADTSRMAFNWVGNRAWWSFKLLYTHDGGKTWNEGSRSGSVGDVMPVSSWEATMNWHPIDKNILMANGPYISTDGGKNFNYSRTGFNGICTGGYMMNNVNNNALMAIGSQDFNGGYSLDSGYTWTYVNWSGQAWGGFTYGAYIADENTMVSTVASGWEDPRYLAYTHDGGKTVTRTEMRVKGYEIGYGALNNDDIIFFGEYRSADRGKTWDVMDGCTGVFEHDPETGRLFGANAYTVVYSDDEGKTWTKLCASGDKISDVAYNYKTKTLYVCSSSGLYTVDVNADKALKLLNGKLSCASGVCVDPENPDIMYLCRSWQASDFEYESFFRSLDGGKTWTCLNRTAGDGREGPDGGRRAGSIIFNAVTREVYVTSGCMGIWKIKAAPSDTTN